MADGIDPNPGSESDPGKVPETIGGTDESVIGDRADSLDGADTDGRPSGERSGDVHSEPAVRDQDVDAEDEFEAEDEVEAAREQISGLLSRLADDPDAPPTTVSPLAVIAAARAAANVADDEGTASSKIAVRPNGEGAGGALALAERTGPIERTASAERTASVGELHVLAVHADAEQTRRGRRRTALIALVAAASLAGIAAVAIPLTLSGSSSTETSANAAREAPTAAAADAASPQKAAEPAASGGESAAAAGSADAAAGAVPGAGQDSASGSERPPPGSDAITESVPAPGGPVGEAASPAVPGTADCWPALSDSAIAALTAALPAGMFGDPTALTAECGPDPLGGALLPGTASGNVLVVRVSKADPGACARSTGEAGVRCAPRGEGVYVSVDGGGQSTAFVYGNGNEVAVGGWPATGDSVPIGSGLNDDQLIAAAHAVLGALG